jgi:hypothetical protein
MMAPATQCLLLIPTKARGPSPIRDGDPIPDNHAPEWFVRRGGLAQTMELLEQGQLPRLLRAQLPGAELISISAPFFGARITLT